MINTKQKIKRFMAPMKLAEVVAIPEQISDRYEYQPERHICILGIWIKICREGIWSRTGVRRWDKLHPITEEIPGHRIVTEWPDGELKKIVTILELPEVRYRFIGEEKGRSIIFNKYRDAQNFADALQWHSGLPGLVNTTELINKILKETK